MQCGVGLGGLHVLGAGQLTDCSIHMWQLAVIPICRKCVYTILYSTEQYRFCVEDACKLQMYGRMYNLALCKRTKTSKQLYCKSICVD